MIELISSVIFITFIVYIYKHDQSIEKGKIPFSERINR